jgi:hypothetical protein
MTTIKTATPNLSLLTEFITIYLHKRFITTQKDII